MSDHAAEAKLFILYDAKIKASRSNARLRLKNFLGQLNFYLSPNFKKIHLLTAVARAAASPSPSPSTLGPSTYTGNARTLIIPASS